MFPQCISVWYADSSQFLFFFPKQLWLPSKSMKNKQTNNKYLHENKKTNLLCFETNFHPNRTRLHFTLTWQFSLLCFDESFQNNISTWTKASILVSLYKLLINIDHYQPFMQVVYYQREVNMFVVYCDDSTNKEIATEMIQTVWFASNIQTNGHLRPSTAWPCSVELHICIWL